MGEIPREECKKIPVTVSRPVTEQNCTIVQIRQCEKIPVRNCRDVQGSRNECHEVPFNICADREETLTTFVDEEVCQDVTRKECYDVTNERCQDVISKVPREEPNEVCFEKFVEQCRNEHHFVTKYISRQM